MSSSKREKLSGSVNLTPKERKIIIACMNATTGDIGKVVSRVDDGPVLSLPSTLSGM